MSIFKTEADVMVATAGRVDETNNQVQAELNRLRGVVDGLRGSWQGTAQVSFDNLMERWGQQATRLRESLDLISENIRSNAKNFTNVEAQNTSAFNSAASVGGGLDL